MSYLAIVKCKELYKVFINPLLDFYRNNYLGFQIGSIQVKSPTCADDIVLLGRSQLELQTMLLGQEQYANDKRYIISEAKSKVMIFNQKKQHIDENFTLHDRQIAHTNLIPTLELIENYEDMI
jgi:hypothetical protein